MSLKKNSFPSKYKLKLKRHINYLFNNSRCFYDYPLKVFYAEIDDIFPSFKVIINCPKKNLKLAVERNKVKRRIFEATRLNRHDVETLLHTYNKKYAIALIYVSKQVEEYQTIEKSIVNFFNELKKVICQLN